MLAGQLPRRGVTLSIGTLAAVLSDGAASACVPLSLSSTRSSRKPRCVGTSGGS